MPNHIHRVFVPNLQTSKYMFVNQRHSCVMNCMQKETFTLLYFKLINKNRTRLYDFFVSFFEYRNREVSTFWRSNCQYSAKSTYNQLLQQITILHLASEECFCQPTRSATISRMRFLAPSTHSFAPFNTTLSLLTPVRGKLTMTPPNSSAICRSTSPRRATK